MTDALGSYADDTPISVLAPGTGKTKTGRLWTYVRDDQPAVSTDPPAVLFRYSPDRKAERPRAHLNDLSEVFARIAEHPINRIEQLLPWNIARDVTDKLRSAA